MARNERQGRKPIKSVKITSDLILECNGKLGRKRIHLPNHKIFHASIKGLLIESLEKGILSENGTKWPPPLPPGCDKELFGFLRSMKTNDLLSEGSRKMKKDCEEWWRNRSQRTKAEEAIKTDNHNKMVSLLEGLVNVGDLDFYFDILTHEEAVRAFKLSSFMADRYDAMCRGKKVFANQVDAEACRATYEVDTGDMDMGVYQCLICEQWHMGHDKKKLSQPVMSFSRGTTPGVGVKIAYGNPAEGTPTPVYGQEKNRAEKEFVCERSEEWKTWLKAVEA